MIMGKFTRGTVVYHKAMGRGVAINELRDGMVEVRMENGQREKFYPEELESQTEVDTRSRNEIGDNKNWRIGD